MLIVKTCRLINQIGLNGLIYVLLSPLLLYPQSNPITNNISKLNQISEQSTDKVVISKARFDSDSMLFGQKIKYLLTVTSPLEYQILLPDSTSKIEGFTLLGSKTFPTRINNNNQIDSVVYELISFSLDSVQFLNLPIKIFTDKDSILTFSNTDSICLKTTHLGKIMKSDTELLPLKYRFNYQMALILMSLFILILWIVKKFLWKRFLVSWKKINQKTRFIKYTQNQEKIIQNFSKTSKIQFLEKFITDWKIMMGELSQKPIETYTSTEIHQYFNDEALFAALQKTDKALYSQIYDADLLQSMDLIYRKSVEEFDKIHN